MKIQIKTQEFMKAPPELEMMMWLMVGEVLDVPEVIQGTVVQSEEWRGSDPPPTSQMYVDVVYWHLNFSDPRQTHLRVCCSEKVVPDLSA